MSKDPLELEKSYIAAHDAIEHRVLTKGALPGAEISSRVMERVILTEAQFLDDTLKKYIPAPFRWMTNQRHYGWLGRVGMLFIALSMQVQGLRVDRKVDRELQTGKGFRKESRITTISQIRVQVWKGDKLIAEKPVRVGIIG